MGRQPRPPKTRAAPRQPFDPERQAEILGAALRVFARKGFHRTTVRDIAREAGLADGTIYNHFENKSALLLALLEGLNRRGREETGLEAVEDEPLETFLPRHFRFMLEALTKGTGDALPVILAELLTNPELRQAYARRLLEPNAALGEEALARWVRQGRVRGETPELKVRMVSALLLGLVVGRLLGDQGLVARWDELPGAAADFVLNGIKKS